MNILIIEDEKYTAKDLSKIILLLEPTANIVAMIETVQDGIEFLNSNKNIDLIFSDIQLGDGISFEIFEKIDLTIPIIFCTAFNEYALKAFETTGIDYVLKPFSKDAIKKALTKFKTITRAITDNQNDLQKVLSLLSAQMKPNHLPNIIVQQADKIIPISGSEIALFYIENAIVKAFLFDKKIMVVSYNLDELESKFSPQFFRINRQFLVNRKAVNEASQYFNRKLLVHTVFPFTEQILVPKDKVTDFLSWLAEQ